MYATRSLEVEVCTLNPLHFLSGERQLLLIKTKQNNLRKGRLEKKKDLGTRLQNNSRFRYLEIPQPLTPVTGKEPLLCTPKHKSPYHNSKQKEHIKLIM